MDSVEGGSPLLRTIPAAEMWTLKGSFGWPLRSIGLFDVAVIHSSKIAFAFISKPLCYFCNKMDGDVFRKEKLVGNYSSVQFNEKISFFVCTESIFVTKDYCYMCTRC